MQIYKDPWTVAGFRLQIPEELGLPFSHIGEFSVIKEMTLGLHSHDTWEFVLQLEGATTWTHHHRQLELREGELLVCPPGLKHEKSVKEVADFRLHFLGCKMDLNLWNDLKNFLPEDRMTKFSDAQEIARNFKIIQEELLFAQLRQKEGVELAWKQFWMTVLRLAASPPVWSRKNQWLVQRVRTLVEANPGERWTLPAIARLMGHAPNYFASLFKRESGTSFHKYLIDVRIEAAKKALELGEETVTEIAFRMGFSSSQHLSRMFAEKTKVVPSRWNQRRKPDQALKMKRRASK